MSKITHNYWKKYTITVTCDCGKPMIPQIKYGCWPTFFAGKYNYKCGFCGKKETLDRVEGWELENVDE